MAQVYINAVCELLLHRDNKKDKNYVIVIPYQKIKKPVKPVNLLFYDLIKGQVVKIIEEAEVFLDYSRDNLG